MQSIVPHISKKRLQQGGVFKETKDKIQGFRALNKRFIASWFRARIRDCSSFYGPTGICIWTPRRVQSVLADTIEKDSQSRRLASEFSRRSAPLSHSTKTGYPQIINKTYTFRDHPVIASSLCKIDLRTIWDLNNSLSNRTWGKDLWIETDSQTKQTHTREYRTL